MAKKATSEYNPVLDKVESKAVEITSFVAGHPDCKRLLELVGEFLQTCDEAAKEMTNQVLANPTGTRSFVSKGKGASGSVDIRQDLKGAALIRDHGAELLEHNPRSLKVTKSEYNKFPLEGVDLNDYLEMPKFVPTVTSTDKEVKAIIEKLKYVMECHQMDAPEHADDIESWYAIYDTLKRVEY